MSYHDESTDLVPQPQAVVVQLGVDAMAGDPHAIHNFSSQGILACVRHIKAWSLPTLFLGGGGYESSHASQAWASATAEVLGRWSDEPSCAAGGLSPDTPIPLHSHWPEYKRSSLEVPAGETIDRNDDAYLTEVEEVFKRHVEVLSR